MAFVAWPTAFGNPDAPYDGFGSLPLKTGDRESLGAFKTDRVATRPIVRGSVGLVMTGTLFDQFRDFWKTTLNRGTSMFTAPWIDLIGYVGYVARIVTYTMSTDGSMPKVTLDLELHPWVRTEGGDVSPWPTP